MTAPAKEITSERLADAINLARIGAGKDGYRSYPGTGGIWCGENNGIADADFVDWGLARAVTIILNAALDGSLAATRAAGDAPVAWMPIETAPKDGRLAIVYRPLALNSGDQPVAVKRLMGGNQHCWESTVPEGSEPFNPTDGSCHVTHWQPLPAPPALSRPARCAPTAAFSGSREVLSTDRKELSQNSGDA